MGLIWKLDARRRSCRNAKKKRSILLLHSGKETFDPPFLEERRRRFASQCFDTTHQSAGDLMETTLNHIQRRTFDATLSTPVAINLFSSFFFFFVSVLTEFEIRIRILSPAASRFCPSPSSLTALPAGGGADSAAFPFFNLPGCPYPVQAL